MINKIELRVVKTCYACPEQYDVYLNEDIVGYVRLRFGSFRCNHINGVEDDNYDWVNL